MKNLAKDHPKIGSMVKIFPTVHEPARRQEVTEKLNVVNGMLRDKLAKARRLILCIEFGCDICHPDQGVAYE